MGIKIEAKPGSGAETLMEMKAIPLDTETTAEEALAHSFRTLLLNMNVSVEKWKELMEAYLDKQNIVDPMDRVSARANLTKELANNKMTWKIYCHGLRVLGLTDIRFAIYGASEDAGLVDAGVAFKLK